MGGYFVSGIFRGVGAGGGTVAGLYVVTLGAGMRKSNRNLSELERSTRRLFHWVIVLQVATLICGVLLFAGVLLKWDQ